VKIKFWGVRGSLPVPGPDTVRYGGNTSCVEVRSGDEVLIIDGGSGLRGLGEALMAECAAKGGAPLVCHMLFGHAHWDHIQGFPFFVPGYVAGNIIHLYTAEGHTRCLDEVLKGQQEFTYFPVRFSDMSATIVPHDIGSAPLQIGELVVLNTPLNHPGGCLGYRFQEGERAAAYLCDHEPHLRVLQSPQVRLRLADEGTSLQQARKRAEADDRRIVDFARGAELMIADAAYTEEEYPAKVGYGHSTIDEAIDRAMRANVKTVALTHHDMSHSDEKLDRLGERAQQLLDQAGAETKCVVAHEGLEIEL